MPRVTVLLPVRDQAASLRSAMQSILEQQWHDLQLLVLDDGSLDGSGEIAAAVQDPRVVVYRGEQSVGLPAVLNKGLGLSDSEYIARMDADDWSHPRRLSAQIDYLDSRRDVAACGTAVKVVMSDGSHHIRRYPTTHAAIRARLLFENALAHPATLLRRTALERLDVPYDPAYPKSQDYDLWERLSRVCKLANLRKPYLAYRVQPRGAEHSKCQQALADQVRWRQLEALGVRPTESQWQLHCALCVWDATVISQRANELEHWLQQLIDANLAADVYDRPVFREEIMTRFRYLCRLISKHGADGWSHWHHASTLRAGAFRITDYLRLPLWHRARAMAAAGKV